MDRGRGIVKTAAAAIRTALAGAIDYAGLFPPAALDLRRTIENFAAYRRSAHRWALGRLVVPASLLQELRDGLCRAGESSAEDRWSIAAVLGADPATDLGHVATFNAMHASSGNVAVDVVEVRVASSQDVWHVAGLAPSGVSVACELPWPSLDPAILDACGACGAAAKLRTGGVVASAIPPTEVVATFLWRAARRRVRVKATAGLHHAVRGEYRLTYEPEAPSATLHGFLNVIIAAAWAWAHADEQAPGDGVPAPLEEVLLSRGNAALVFGHDGGVQCGEVTLPPGALARARAAFLASFGSCSFDEPLDELQQLGLLS